MTLLEDGHVAIGRRVVELVGLAIGAESLVEMNAEREDKSS